MLDSLRSDIVFGWRQLKKNKVTSAAAILSLALAIGACTSAFRLVDALLLRPLPVANPERLQVVVFQGGGPDGKHVSQYDSCSYPMFTRMRDSLREQAQLIAVSYADRVDLTFGSDNDMERAHLQYISGDLFPVFGLRPALGRLLTASDDVKLGAHPYAVLSFDYWTRRFGRDTNIVGRKFRMADTIYEVVGVAPEPFTGTETGTVTEIFVPMMMKNPTTLASSNNFWLRTFVKLKPGVAPESVHDRLSATFHAIQVERARGFVNMTPFRLAIFFQEKLLLQPAASGRSNMQRDYSRALAALAILVALVLLIACANVANLMTARAAVRAHEMALRVSIGASRWRLIQLVLTESAWLAVLSTALGALFAWQAAPLVLGMINSPDDPARLALPADGRVLAFAFVLAAAVTFLFGIVPALRSSGVKPALALKGGEDPHSRRRVMHGLIALQVAFCFLVLFVAGLFVNSFDRLSNQALGFSPDRVLNLETLARRPQLPAYWDKVADNLRAVPGVEKVAITAWPILTGESSVSDVAVNGGPPSEMMNEIVRITPGWAAAMNVPLIGGRDFLPNETNPGVAIVNQAFAKQHFNGQDPTGKWFETVNGNNRTRIQVVGYFPNARTWDMRRPIRPTMFIPYYASDADRNPRPANRGTFVVRTAGADPLALAAVLRQVVAHDNPQFFVENIRTQVEIDGAQTVRERLLAVLSIFFAAVALLLAGVGLYGVLDYSVLQRRREIGIRLAIGARSGEIARRVTADVFVMVLAGAVGGLVLGMISTRYIETLFFQVKATDPGALALPSLMIVAAAMLAALPAIIHALRTDLAKALRAE